MIYLIRLTDNLNRIMLLTERNGTERNGTERNNCALLRLAEARRLKLHISFVIDNRRI